MPPTFIYICLWLHWIGRLLDKFKLLDNDVKADVVLCFSKKCTLQHLINQNKIAEVSNLLYCISTVSLRMFTHVHLPKIWFCLEQRSVFGQMHTHSLFAHKNTHTVQVLQREDPCEKCVFNKTRSLVYSAFEERAKCAVFLKGNISKEIGQLQHYHR